ncbi:ISL3 family transposase, partial [Enterococcus durans]
MSHTQLIKDTLNILDLNIHFEENCLTKEKYKGQICLIYKGTLLYKPEECPHCLCVVPSRIIRWGTTTVRLLLNDVSEYRTYLELKKQRFKCKSCQRTFVADTSVAEKYCFISQKVRWSVIARLKENTSMTEIARQKNISTSSVYRVMKRFYRPLNPFKQTLPKVLCFDEFKSVRHVTSAMSFIMMDGQSHALLDIVENRRLPYLERYFSRFSLATREAVQWIVIDMYAPYVSLVKKLFPNAQLIIDRFHIVQHIGRTFLNHRVSRIIRWGTTTVRLLLNDVSEYRTYLELKKQRFKCKSCQRTFVADTSVAEKHCFISQKVRWSVIARLKENTSMTEIARQKNISTSSVYRVMKRFYRPLNPFKQTLPKVLCFDEFKSVRSVATAMSFIMMDGQSHALLDIVENRRLPYLERYFSRFSLATREAVQ